MGRAFPIFGYREAGIPYNLFKVAQENAGFERIGNEVQAALPRSRSTCPLLLFSPVLLTDNHIFARPNLYCTQKFVDKMLRSPG
jgi:hypothetical protein